MEEVGTQVASPLFLHQRFCDAPLIGTKRYYNNNSIANYPQIHPSAPAHAWNPNDWEWDTTRFLARPRPQAQAQPHQADSDVLCLGTLHPFLPPNNKDAPINPKSGASHADDDHQASNSLRLQLGAGGSGVAVSNGTAPSVGKTNVGTAPTSNSAEDMPSSSRPNKKVRSGSPGSGGNYPMCQVDNCREDLSKAKDYHRRHKVCEFHSKATKALVAQHMQRFCQQCSRFHPLSEFDEGKRSCRRRLAGHNKRRRKTQAEDASPPAAQSNDNNKTGYGNLDIVNLLTVLAGGQGNAEQNGSICSPVPDKNQLIQMLSKIKSLAPPTDTAVTPLKSPNPTKNDIEEGTMGQKSMETNATSKPTTNLLAALSATLAASSPDTHALFSQMNNPCNVMDKITSAIEDKDAGLDALKTPLSGERSSPSYQSPIEDSDSQVHDTRMNIPLQLFSSSPGEDSSPNLDYSRKYVSSDSSNPTEERCHSSNAPVTRNLFPLETTFESAKPVRFSLNEDPNVTIEQSQTETSASMMTRELFNIGNRAVSNSGQSLPPQAVYTSSSGSDHSPPSFNSDPQKDRTGRIMFKLFDKDPSHFPGALRTEIYNWLSNSPSEMESYIRPGCVVLSIYLSMTSAAWDQLEENFLQQVEALVQLSDLGFWRSGRFSVNMGRQLAVHKDGKVRICKPWSTVDSPELFIVSPLAVVKGEETTLLLKGRNLTSGTKVHCSYMGAYSSRDILRLSDQGASYGEIKLTNFKVHATASSELGRCFVEVENGVRGNCFPLIIADSKICQELRLLECEFNEAKGNDDGTDDQAHIASLRSHEEVLHFLNELGWLFQRHACPDIAVQDYTLHRLQYLLTFSTERDYCALVKKLLDIVVEAKSGMHGFPEECIEALANMRLLHRAVKRRSKKMVEMLIHYSAPCGRGLPMKYIFPPNLRGPGGITPLHLAACTSDSYDIVDVLTDDPMQIGLHSWRSLLDDSGQSPYSYAMMRNDHALNTIVAQKLSARRNSHVSITMGSEILESSMPGDARQRTILQPKVKQSSCSKCAMMSSYSRMRGSQSFLHRPFIHSMLTIAAVCVCVCLYFKSMHVNSVSFKWENVEFGAM